MTEPDQGFISGAGVEGVLFEQAKRSVPGEMLRQINNVHVEGCNRNHGSALAFEQIEIERQNKIMIKQASGRGSGAGMTTR